MSEIETVKVGRKTFGTFNEVSGIYRTARDYRDEMFRGGKGISAKEALRKGTGSWSIDKAIVDEMPERGVKVIQVWEVVERKLYEADMETFLGHAFRLNYQGEQLALQLKHWNIKES